MNGSLGSACPSAMSEPDTVEAGQPAPAGAALHGRLHPSVIALWSLQAAAPLAVAWVASSVERVVGLAILVLTLGFSWVRWLRYQWRIEADQLVIEHGLVQRTQRVIPIDRIQAVQTVRKIRHRIFGVVGLRIETVGGNETEGQLDALVPAVAAQAQRLLLRRPLAESSGAPQATGTVLARCTPRMLLLAGLTGGRIGVAAAALAFASQFGGERVTDAIVSAPQRFGITVVVIAVAVAAVLAFAGSVAATTIAYWDFTVVRDGRLIRVLRGVLNERRDTVPVTRIQTLVIEENLIRRAIGLASVKMVVAGRAGEDESFGSVLLPIASRTQAFALAGDVLGLDGLERLSLTPMPMSARTRHLARSMIVVAGATAIMLTLADGAVGFTGLLTAGLAVPWALGTYRALGWRRDEHLVMARAGWFVRRTSITPLLAPQSVRVSSTPVQQRLGLATLRLEIARSRGASDPRLLDLRHGDAESTQMVLADAAGAPAPTSAA